MAMAASDGSYALLLIVVAIVEYLRVCGSPNRFCSAWAFAVLGIVGAAPSLLVHDYSAGSGATSSEARAYSVNLGR